MEEDAGDFIGVDVVCAGDFADDDLGDDIGDDFLVVERNRVLGVVVVGLAVFGGEGASGCGDGEAGLREV